MKVRGSRNLWFCYFWDIIFDEVSIYYSNLHVHVKPHNEASLPMTPSAPMLAGSSSSLSMGEQCDKGSGVGFHELHE